MKKYDINKAITYHKTGIDLIRARKLKEIISPSLSTKHVGEEIFICDKEKVHGIIILNEPTSLTVAQFKNHASRHLITEEAKDNIWPSVKKFNAYTFRIKKVFKNSLEYMYKGQEDLEISELIEGVEIIDREAEALQALVNKYNVRLETLKGIECDKDNEVLKNLYIRLFELYLKRMLQKPQHTGIGGARRCPPGMVRDRRTGRCVRRKTKSEDKNLELTNV